MKKAAVFAALIGAIALAASAFPAGQDETALVQKYKLFESSVLKAQKYLDQGKVEKCDAELAACLASVPDHHAALYIRAQRQYKDGAYESALASMDQAKAGFARLDAAVKKLQSEKLNRQMTTTQEAVDAEPDIEARAASTKCKEGLYAGDMMYSIGRLNQKEEELKQSLIQSKEISPAEYLYFTGNIQFRLRRAEEAERSYRAALEADPGHSNAYTNLINLLFAQKRLDEAKDFLAKAEANKAQVHPGLRKAVLEAK